MVSLFPSRQVFLDLFGFQIHWYGVMYLSAFLVAAWMLPRLQKYRDIVLSKDDWLTLVSYLVVGVLVGGRLGYVFLYEPSYFLAHPLDVFAVWKGGMASHGGFVGVTLAAIVFCRRKSIPFLPLMDIVVIPAAIGLAFGRMGNFINGELYGTVTTLPWGMTFPGVEGARHPLQIYDASLSIAIAWICFSHLKRFHDVSGRTVASFLMLYGIMRFCLEFIREQQFPLIHIGFASLTRGQLYTIPVFVIGVILWLIVPRFQRIS